MKKKGLVAVMALMIGGSFLAKSGYVEAESDRYIRIADENIRGQALYPAIKNLYDFLGDNNNSEKEIEDAVTLFEEYGLLKDIYAPLVNNIEGELNEDTTSIEGVQKLSYANEVNFEGGRMIDFRPIANLTNVEKIDMSVNTSLPNLNVFSKLTKMKNFRVSFLGTRSDESRYVEDTSNGHLALLDITALNNMPDLKYAQIGGKGQMQPIVLKKGMTTYQMISPIQLSSQFDGAKITYNGSNFIEEDDVLYWSEIEAPTKEAEGTTKLTFGWDVKNKSYSYSGQADIPIIWKN